MPIRLLKSYIIDYLRDLEEVKGRSWAAIASINCIRVVLARTSMYQAEMHHDYESVSLARTLPTYACPNVDGLGVRDGWQRVVYGGRLS